MILSRKNRTFLMDTHEFLKRHFDRALLRPDENRTIPRIMYAFHECVTILSDVIECFKKEDRPPEIDAPCTVIGDLNGRYDNLMRLLHIKQNKDLKPVKTGIYQTNRTVFLGNYLNMQGESLQTLFLLFALKVAFPDQYILLRGSHEYSIANNKRFRREIVNMFDVTKGSMIFQFFEEAFFHMPLCAVIGQTILCVHSGISPFLNSMNDLKMLPRRVSKIAKTSLARDLVWGTPLDFETVHAVSDQPQFVRNICGASSYSFNDVAVKHCLKRLNIQLIVRSHDCYNQGYRFFADYKMVTVFSTPNFKRGNSAAILQVHRNGGISFDRILSHKMANLRKNASARNAALTHQGAKNLRSRRMAISRRI